MIIGICVEVYVMDGITRIVGTIRKYIWLIKKNNNHESKSSYCMWLHVILHMVTLIHMRPISYQNHPR